MKPNPRVLLVEDEPNVLMSEEMCLQDAGYEVITATDGLDGLNKAFDTSPDVVLLDALLPRMNGLLVLQALKADDRTKNVPVVMVSARAQVEDIDKAMKVGADGYVTKPFFPSDLLAQIRRLTEKWLAVVFLTAGFLLMGIYHYASRRGVPRV